MFNILGFFLLKKMENLIKLAIYFITKHFRAITNHTEISVQKYIYEKIMD